MKQGLTTLQFSAVCLLAAGLASDLFGGIFTVLFNGLLTPLFVVAALALPLLVFAFAIGLLGHRGPRRTR